jgi:hypothetical protein
MLHSGSAGKRQVQQGSGEEIVADVNLPVIGSVQIAVLLERTVVFDDNSDRNLVLTDETADTAKIPLGCPKSQ